MTDEETNSIAPPYISFRTFLNLIDRLASGGIPQHIDRHYWKGFLSGSLGPQVMAALRFFLLITGTDNEPTPELERFVEDKENRKQIFAEMLRRFYVPVFNDNDLARATAGDLDRTFSKHYKLSADTRRKSISFFLHALQYAELPVSSYLKEASRTSTATKSPARTGKKSQQNTPPGVTRAASSPKTPITVPIQQSLSQATNTKTINLRSGGDVTLTYSLDLFGLDKRDREFLFGLIDQLQSYEQDVFTGDLGEGEEMEEEDEIEEEDEK